MGPFLLASLAPPHPPVNRRRFPPPLALPALNPYPEDRTSSRSLHANHSNPKHAPLAVLFRTVPGPDSLLPCEFQQTPMPLHGCLQILTTVFWNRGSLDAARIPQPAMKYLVIIAEDWDKVAFLLQAKFRKSASPASTPLSVSLLGLPPPLGAVGWAVPTCCACQKWHMCSWRVAE